MKTAEPYQIRVIPSLQQVDRQSWNRLACISATGSNADGKANTPGNPFVSHEFLCALEESGSAGERTGWLGQHLLLEAGDGTLLAAMPCYLKNNSQGEYVFDHGWAEAFYRAGGKYYPKLQCSVPFTPVSGPRFLTGDSKQPEALRAALMNGLKQLCVQIGASSAHITFMQENEWQSAGSQQFLKRIDRQFHWKNDNFESFADFLDTLASRKRKNIRRERQAAQAVKGLEIVHLTGSELSEEVWDAFYRFYMDTGLRKWGNPYLTREFYTLIGERMADRIVLIMAKRAGQFVAGAINFLGDNCLYGRHWGCVEDHPYLHFEICYYQAIEYAIANKLQRVEAGAQGEHKLARGYIPASTYSAHWIVHPGLRNAVNDYLAQERNHIEIEKEFLLEHAPFKKA